MGKVNAKESIKTLGLQWDPEGDCFKFSINASNTSEPTKRIVLSTIAKIYDPLGWLSPIVIVSKLLMQQLWLDKNKWDENLKNEEIMIWK